MKCSWAPVVAAFLIILTAPGAKAASPLTVNLWPDGRMPGHGATVAESELPMRGDGFHRVTNISTPTVSFFPSATASKDIPAPVMIVCPGGGYSYLVFDKEGTEIAAWLNAAGISALVLKYRAPNNQAGALQDAQRAISLTRAHAAEWGLDPKRVGIIGFSAGGNLAAKASTLFDHRAYSRVDAADQQSCRPDCAVLVYPAYLETQGKLAADLDMNADIPPTLIVHNDDDKTFVAGSKLYHAALDAAKKPNTFLCYATGGHGYALHCTGEARAWPDAARDWLRKNGFK